MMNGSGGHHVLLVDDEEIFLSSLSEGLRRRFPEMTFRSASDGEAALAELGKHPVDLVITDLKMPRMDGFQLIAAMHSQHPSVPLLIMTAHSTEVSEGKVMSAGALHCIDKPVDLAELARRIDELFSTGAIATLRGVSLPAFLQLLGLERKSGIVDVRSSQSRARLYLSGGQIIHAEDGQRSGLEAALRAVSLDDVEINFRPGAVPKIPTIELSLTQLLLDSARMRDEHERDGPLAGAGNGDNFDLAFSESFSEAFDEQLGSQEEKGQGPGASRPLTGPMPRLIRPAPGSSPPAVSGTITVPGSGLTPPPQPALAVPGASPFAAPGAPPSASLVPFSSAVPLPRKQPRTSPPPARAVAPPPPPGSLSSGMAPHSAEANVSDAVATCLRKIAEISGVLGAAFIDFQNGESLGAVTRDMSFDTVAMARANVEVVRAKLALLASLSMQDCFQDIVITTRRHYQVLCMSERRPRQFVFVALSREHSTLALARFLIDEAIDGASGA